jgi:hypothetical protein
MQTAHSQVPGPNPEANESQSVREALRCAAEAVASTGEADIFEVLVLGITRALGMDLAFVGILADRIRALARKPLDIPAFRELLDELFPDCGNRHHEDSQ